MNGIENRCKLTHRGNNLSLETELVLEAACEVADTTLAVGDNVGNLANVVEHVAAREEEHGDQADGGPEVAVLDNRKEVWRGDAEESDHTEHGSGDGDNLHVVDRTNDRWVRSVGEMAAEPCMDGLGFVSSTQTSR